MSYRCYSQFFMLFARRFISFALTIAVIAGSCGIPLVEAYCCDKFESISAYSHHCDGCDMPQDKQNGDCCSTTVIIKKIENAGYIPTKDNTLSALDFEYAIAVIPVETSPLFSYALPHLELPARGSPHDGRHILSLVCRLII